jgi:hypothetical protein
MASYNKYEIVFMETNKKLIGDVIELRKYGQKDPYVRRSELQETERRIVENIKTYIDSKFDK